MAGQDYIWGSTVDGSWDDASNWDDATTGQDPATVAPGADDSVTIGGAGGGAIRIVTGTGNSSSLSLDGAVDLSGSFETGTFDLPTGLLELDAGSSLVVTDDATFGEAQSQNVGLTLGGTLTV